MRLVILDRGTNWIDVFPLPTKEADTAAGCLQSFVGPNVTVGQVSTDSSAELKSAVRQNGWCHATSTPGRPDTNGVAERAIRSVVEGARAALEHSGLHESWWSHAGKHFCFARHVAIINGDSSWNRRHRKGHSNGPLYPFGCLVDFMPTPQKMGAVHKFASRATPGIFIGYVLLPGGRWKGDFLVAPLSEFDCLPGRQRIEVKIQRVKGRSSGTNLHRLSFR